MVKRDIKTLIFVDCEACGKSPSTGKLTEFGAVAYPSRATFHGVLAGKDPIEEKEVFEEFEKRVLQVTDGLRPVFVSDNPAFDWQWINDAMGNLEALDRLLIYLTSWQEEEFSIKVHRSWKGYPFEILDQLREEDCITGSKPAKSVYLTEKGTTKAKELMVKYIREK